MGQALTTAHCCLVNTRCLLSAHSSPGQIRLHLDNCQHSISSPPSSLWSSADLAAHLWFVPPRALHLLLASIDSGHSHTQTPRLHAPPTLEKKFGKTSNLFKTSI